MYLIILAVAILILSSSLSTIIVPSTVREVVENVLKKKWAWTISILRLILGSIFLLAANQCSMPMFIKIMGIALIIAGISLPALGRRRTELSTHWWLNQKDWALGVWGFFGMLFGITLALAAMPI